MVLNINIEASKIRKDLNIHTGESVVDTSRS